MNRIGVRDIMKEYYSNKQYIHNQKQGSKPLDLLIVVDEINYFIHKIKYTYIEYFISSDHIGFMFNVFKENYFYFRKKIERMVPNKKVLSQDKYQIEIFNNKSK